ncbi:hypothetical protein SPRG_04947 [Saprolegnia parasitica CBS 223.65]|uniref:Myosin-binding domain-containing protein n=1 Tax=Saprolegnia parasitica (strain CBS 223.65) TaxID=695850 RepID=A0A067CKZ2_SAPPC|nr:hypothetical protein SPRG_04947 [Saprolegnia parasitica CBS 223.65]KDO29880.1 hypothetical protein SPRG_04947 [Saprolegnia parasitica CBS 223.65]|eukprot:XP_012199475.1 hypothetical protein SPRG_04947 [Saprolegnia parasitica CBS 223.65]
MSWHSLRAGLFPPWPSMAALQQQGLQDAHDGLRSGTQRSLLASIQGAWRSVDPPSPSFIAAAVAVLYGLSIAGSLVWLRIALATIPLSVLLVRLGLATWCFYVRIAAQRRATVLLRAWQEHLALFDATLQAFEDVVAHSLRRIKAAEVVHRGYHLDTLLPPIARLEANRASSIDDLRCVHLRVLLREVFAQLQDPTYVMNVQVTNDAAPSLLLLALSNQQKAARAALQTQLNTLRAQVVSSVSALDDAATQLHRLVATVATLCDRVADVESASGESTLPCATVRTPSPRFPPTSTWHHAHRVQVALDSANALLYAYKQDLAHGHDDDGATRARVAKFVNDAVAAMCTWEKASIPSVDGPASEEPATPPPIDRDSVVSTERAVEVPAPVDPTVTEVFTALSTGRTEADEALAVAPEKNGLLLPSLHSVMDELHDVLDQRVLPPERVNGVEVEAPTVVAPCNVPLPSTSSSTLARPALQLELQKAFQAAAFANDYVLGESDSE